MWVPAAGRGHGSGGDEACRALDIIRSGKARTPADRHRTRDCLGGGFGRLVASGEEGGTR